MTTPTDDPWTRVSELFFEALEAPAAEREALVRRASGTDHALSDEVLALLDAHTDGGGFNRLAQEMGAMIDEDEDGLPIGSRVGAYELVEQIGRGGMGTVYRARRADGEYEQEVALKLHRAEVLRRDARQRLRVERQILARIVHPNIARLLDGGVTEDGRSYFVMEYVDGEPIDRHCDERRLSVSDRLRMFVAVCEAVQHAHRNLVVHRDLKPGNILVTEAGEVKLVDFGIAKLLDDAARTQPVDATRHGVRLLTPAYASPEQVLGEPVTTSSDVYQLGILLYELLTGTHPHRPSGGSLEALERDRMRAETTRPSVATVTARQESQEGPEPEGESSASARAAARGTSPDRLRRRLSGDLDNIVLMAMRREPDRRYPSAGELAADVRRHLSGHPVEARPEGWSYRATKFVGRNRVGVAVASLGLVLISAFTWSSVRQARATATALTQAEQVTNFLVGIFQSSSPEMTGGEALTVREVLDRGAERVRDELVQEPVVQAQLMSVIAQVYEHLDLLDDAVALRRETLETRRAALPPEHEDVAVSLVQLALVLARAGDADEVRAILPAAEAAVRESGLTGAQRATQLNDIGYGWLTLGEHDRAEPLLEEALRMNEATGGPADRRAAMLVNLGNIRMARADVDSAETLFRESLRLRRRGGGQSTPELATSWQNLAAALVDRGDWAGADTAIAEALRIRRAVYPEGHTTLYAALTTRAEVLNGLGDVEGAEALYREALTGYVRALGDDAPQVALTRNDLASLFNNVGRYEDAEPLLARALPIFQERFGPDHLFSAIVQTNLAKSIAGQGRAADAEPLYAPAVDALRAARGRHPSVALALLDWGDVRLAAGDANGALEPLTEALEIMLEVADGTAPMTHRARRSLGRALTTLGRYADAESYLTAAYRAAEGDPDLRSRTAPLLADLYEAWGRPEEARRYAPSG